MSDDKQVGQVFLQESIRAFENMKRLADKAFAQTIDAHFYLRLDEESNSLEVLIQHMHGNMLSRWTDFLTTDGEKETRQRDSEFVSSHSSREELVAKWEEGWKTVFHTLHSLTPSDLLSTVYIRGEGLSVLQAIQRQVSHYGYHIGQIVLLSKHFSSQDWETLSIVRGQSKAFKPL